MNGTLCKRCGEVIDIGPKCPSCGRDSRRDLAGQGLSRFSKYTKPERKRIGQVTAILSGEKLAYKEPRGMKHGIRKYRELEEHEVHYDEKRDLYIRSAVVSTRWYASLKQRDDALLALKRKNTRALFVGSVSKDKDGKEIEEHMS